MLVSELLDHGIMHLILLQCFLIRKAENIILFWYVSCCISYVPMECKLSL